MDEAHRASTSRRHHLRARIRPPVDRTPKVSIYDESGRLAYPPAEVVLRHQEESKRVEERRARRLKDLTENVVSLRELKMRDEGEMEPEGKKRKRRKESCVEGKPWVDVKVG